jgi:MATE family multidrug resistance protein
MMTASDSIGSSKDTNNDGPHQQHQQKHQHSPLHDINDSDGVLKTATKLHNDNDYESNDFNNSKSTHLPWCDETMTASSIITEVRDQMKIIAPMFCTFLLRRIVPLTSLIFVGHIGALELSAIGLASVTFNVSGFSMLLGISGAVSTLASQAYGSGDLESMNATLQRAVLIVLCVVTLPVSLLWLNSERLIVALGQDEEIAHMASQYLCLQIPALWAMTFGQCTQNWLHAQSRANGIAIITLIVALVHPFLCYFYIYGLGLGYRGAALAASTSQFIDLSMLMTYVFVLSDIRTKTKFQFTTACFRDWIPFLRIGCPSLLMQMEWWAAEIVIFLSGTLPNPDATVGAMTIYQSTCSVFYMFPISISNACTTRVGNALGGNQPKKARLAALVGVVATFVIELCVSMSLIVWKEAWVRVYTSDPAVVEVALSVMPFAALYVLCDAMQCSVAGALRGCGKQAVAGPVVFVCYVCLGVPLSVILAFHYRRGLVGLLSGSVTGIGSNFLLFLVVFVRIDWMQVSQELFLKKLKTTTDSSDEVEDNPMNNDQSKSKSSYYALRQEEMRIQQGIDGEARRRGRRWDALWKKPFNLKSWRRVFGNNNKAGDDSDADTDADDVDRDDYKSVMDSSRHCPAVDDTDSSNQIELTASIHGGSSHAHLQSEENAENELVRKYADTFTVSIEESESEK